jgi:hypothetical protein
MQESYREGIANHPGPEPCEGSREAALEALHRGICRLGIELRKRYSRMPMVSDRQKATRLRTKNASAQAILRSRRPQACRETGCPLGAREPGDPVAAREQ